MRSSLGYGIHSEYRPSDTLLLTFDRPTDRAAGRGDKAYVDSLFTFSEALGDSYSGEWVDASTFAARLLTPGETAPRFGHTLVNVTGDVRNAAGEPSTKMAPAYLGGAYDTGQPPALVGYDARDPDNGDVLWSDGDQLLLSFDSPTDRGRTVGGRAFVDGLLEFTDGLGVDYSAEWRDASTVTITSVVAHPNFLGYDSLGTSPDRAAALGAARCEWGAGFATTPTEMSATRVRCASYLHAAPAERRLQLALNTVDYTP